MNHGPTPEDLDNASLGLALLTAWVNDAPTPMRQVVEEHVNTAPSISEGMSDVINGLVFNAANLLVMLSRATGQSQVEILQELGAMYADRDATP